MVDRPSRDLELWHVFGTASRRSTASRPHTAAHAADTQDHESQTFPQVKALTCGFERVGRLGLEPTTDGL